MYENIAIENITGHCGLLIALAPWTQFFNLKNSDKKPFGIVRNITFSNIDMKCNRVGDIKGNPEDKVSNILFENIAVNAIVPTLKTNNYPKIKTKNVVVNGTPLVLK